MNITPQGTFKAYMNMQIHISNCDGAQPIPVKVGQAISCVVMVMCLHHFLLNISQPVLPLVIWYEYSGVITQPII